MARKERAEKLARAVFAAMAAAMVVPLLLIVGYLVYLAWPSLGPEFILDIPRRGMTDGGIWPAFVGTLYLVGLSLAGLDADRRAGRRVPERVRARQLVQPRRATWP